MTMRPAAARRTVSRDDAKDDPCLTCPRGTITGRSTRPTTIAARRGSRATAHTSAKIAARSIACPNPADGD